jgi:hypothetical protein
MPETHSMASAALPNGPAEVQSARFIDFVDEKTGIKFATPSADGFIPAPWHVRGEVKPTSDAVTYDLTLTFTPQQATGAAKESLVRFSGQLSKTATARIDDGMLLEGWNVIGLGVQTRKSGEATVADYGAAPEASAYRTVADIRKKIAQDNYPGELDKSKNFTGFWKQDCEEAFGLQIMHFGTDSKYSIVFCGPGGCGEPGQDGRTTFITNDPHYRVISEDEIRTSGVDGWNTYHRCTKETHPVLKYKEESQVPKVPSPRVTSAGLASKADEPHPKNSTTAKRSAPSGDWELIRSISDKSWRCTLSSVGRVRRQLLCSTRDRSVSSRVIQPTYRLSGTAKISDNPS